MSLSLSEDKTAQIDESWGHHSIEIKNGQVRMKTADCQGQDCVNTGWISSPKQVILCLPHHLSISIEEINKKEEIDAIAY